MIQRIQSVYLFVIFILGILTVFLPFYIAGDAAPEQADDWLVNISKYSFFLPALAGLLSLLALFLYKNRKLQLKLCLIIIIFILLSILQIGLIFSQTSPGVIEDLDAAAFIPVIMFIFAFLARRSINKDEKLVKSLDRLR